MSRVGSGGTAAIKIIAFLLPLLRNAVEQHFPHSAPEAPRWATKK